MSSQNKDIWMSKAQGNIGENGELAHSNSSRVEPKRSHQWFMDGNDADFFPNKKQAVEVPHPNSYTALLNSNVYCESSSNFPSVAGQFSERFFDNEPPRTTNLFGVDSACGGFSYGGIRKVKVSQVKDADDFLSDTFNRVDNNFMSVSVPYRENTEYMSVGPSASKDNTQSFVKEDENNISMDAFNQQNNSLSMDLVYGKPTDDQRIPMGHSFGEDNIISFGGLNEDADNISSSGRLVCNYDFLMGQSLIQRSEEKGLSESTSDAVISGAQVISNGDAILKRKEQKLTKKIPPNNFPSNVRSLLSTGMLDGVPVKYVAWSREELHGVIKGATYLCGCKSCTFSKAINAYEFERHAGCKTKHPNNHIYFENGKTIYGVVQELRNTPQDVLFEVIQTITGSQINQKSFRIWKGNHFLLLLVSFSGYMGKKKELCRRELTWSRDEMAKLSC
ncbi:putative Jas TPL-binding domain-containing protein [Helianthus annuus]|nr:putative Jas TPL-binding domain-containing protein [Helianthus annuus]